MIATQKGSYMPYADIIIFVVIFAFGFKGWLKGFVLEFFTFIGLLVGAFVSMWLMNLISGGISEGLGISKNIVSALVFIIGFILIAFGFGVLGTYVHKKTEKAQVIHMNRTLGTIFGAAKGLLLAGVVMVMLGGGNTSLLWKIKKGSYFAGELMQKTEELLKALEKAFS